MGLKIGDDYDVIFFSEMACQSFLEVIPFINLLSQVQVAVTFNRGLFRIFSVDSCFLLRKPRHVFCVVWYSTLCLVLPLCCSGLLHLASVLHASYTGEDKQT